MADVLVTGIWEVSEGMSCFWLEGGATGTLEVQKNLCCLKLDDLIASSDSKSYINKRFYYLFFHSHTMHLDIIKVFYLPTDAQENCFEKNIKIYIKTAPTSFGAITTIRERII